MKNNKPSLTPSTALLNEIFDSGRGHAFDLLDHAEKILSHLPSEHGTWKGRSCYTQFFHPEEECLAR